MRRGLQLFIVIVAVGLGLVACDPGGGNPKENGGSSLAARSDSSGAIQPGQGVTGAAPLELFVIDFAKRSVTKVVDVPPSSVPTEMLSGGSPEAQALLGEWAALAQQLESQGASNLTRTEVTFGEAQGLLARLGLKESSPHGGAPQESLALDGRGPGEGRCARRIPAAHLLGLAALLSTGVGPMDSLPGVVAVCVMAGAGALWTVRPPR